MNDALKKEGMIEMAHIRRGMMSSVPHSMKLPNTYSRDRDARTTSIMRKAKGMSDLLKTGQNGLLLFSGKLISFIPPFPN